MSALTSPTARLADCSPGCGARGLKSFSYRASQNEKAPRGWAGGAEIGLRDWCAGSCTSQAASSFLNRWKSAIC